MALRLSEFFALAPLTRPALLDALKAGSTSSLTVLVACLLFGPQVGPVALFGSMLAQWEVGRPLIPRILCAVIVGTVMTATMALGVLVAPHRLLVIPVVVAVVVVMTMAYYSFQLSRGPGPLHLFYATAIGSYFGLFPAVAWPSVAVTAFSTAFTGFLTLLFLIPDRHRPERRAVADAWSSVGAYALATRNGTAPDALRMLRHTAYAAVNRAWLTLQSATLGPFGRRGIARFEAAAHDATRHLAELVTARIYPGVPLAARATTARTLRGHPGFFFLLRHGFRPHSIAWFTAARLGLAAAIAGIASDGLGLGHPYWSILTATLVLHQWTDRLTTTLRALRRAVGTVLGLGVVLLVAWIDPDPWPMVAVIIGCIFGMCLLLPVNYAFAIVFVTPMALLSIEATGHGGTIPDLLHDRLLETLLGVGIAILVVRVTGRQAEPRLVRAQIRRTIGAIHSVLTALATERTFAPDGLEARAALQFELLTTTTVLTRATADISALSAWHPVELALIDLGYAAMSGCWIDHPAATLSVGPALAALDPLIHDPALIDGPRAAPDAIRALLENARQALTNHPRGMIIQPVD